MKAAHTRPPQAGTVRRLATKGGSMDEEACNGTCSGLNVTWSLLRQGAQDYYGGNTSDPQYVHFRDRADEFGVDEDL